jgi:hypothetical protein
MFDVTGVVGMTQLNGRRFTVANVNAGANTFELTDQAGNVNTATFGAYVSGGVLNRVYTVVSPYVEADLFALKFAQSADVLYITHPSYQTRKLSRTSDTAWTFSLVTFLDGPYSLTNPTSTTLTPSAATGNGITVTASSIVGINGGIGFQSTDVGRLIRMKEGAIWGYVRIVGWTSTTVVTADVINTLTNVTAKVIWRMGLYSNTSGWPSAVTFHEDRLGLAGNTLEPERGDLSKTGDYENFAPSDTDGTVTDSHAVQFTLRSDDVQVVRWMKSDERGLIMGTAEGEWAIRPSTQNEAITPTNRKATQSRAHGSTNTQAIRAAGGLLFIQKSGRKIREVAYDFYEDKFKAPDLTLLSEHITVGGIKEMAYQQDPQSIVWMVKNAAQGHGFVGLTYERDQKVIGWHRHNLGGFSNAGKTIAPIVESTCVVPSADGTRDEPWFVTQRYINGRVVRAFEFMTKLWEKDVDVQANAIFVDAALTYNGVPTMTLTGLYHLAGETVQILVDGATHPDVVVSATGGVTLVRLASTVQVGYSYNSDGQALRPEAGAADGTSQGKTQRTHRCTFRVHDSEGLFVGANFNTSGPGKLTQVPMRTSAMPTDQAVPLFSGDVPVTWEGDYTLDNYVCWRWSQPLPGTVLALMPGLHTQDR